MPYDFLILKNLAIRNFKSTRSQKSIINPQSSGYALNASFEKNRMALSISVWADNGCCDIDYLKSGEKNGKFLHGEFKNENELLEFVRNSFKLTGQHQNL